MADFKQIRDFTKGNMKKYPYQDPTYLSFVILFDFNNKNLSPFLSDPAETYLSKLAEKDSYFAEKLEALQNFKKALKAINNDMPWYWQSLTGVERLLKYNPDNAYWGGDEAVLTITTLESINLAVAGLMHLYRKAVFDEIKWSWVLPANLRKFRMFVYVTEVRTIKNLSKPKINGLDLNQFPENFKPSIQIANDNSEISGRENRPYFMFGLSECEFDITSGAVPFAELNKSPEGPATNEIVIKYENLTEIQSRVLNGIVSSEFNNDKISPAPDSESVSFNSLGEYAQSKLNQKLEDIKSGAIDNLERFSREKQLELIQAARNLTVNRVQDPVNAFQNFVAGVDGATDINQQTRDIGAAIKENVYGNTGGSTIDDALKGAAQNALGNIYNGQ